jgi:hypothetical protein
LSASVKKETTAIHSRGNHFYGRQEIPCLFRLDYFALFC